MFKNEFCQSAILFAADCNRVWLGSWPRLTTCFTMKRQLTLTSFFSESDHSTASGKKAHYDDDSQMILTCIVDSNEPLQTIRQLYNEFCSGVQLGCLKTNTQLKAKLHETIHRKNNHVCFTQNSVTSLPQ